MNYCPNCGIKISVKAKYCGECGVELGKYGFEWAVNKNQKEGERGAGERRRGSRGEEEHSDKMVELDLEEAARRGLLSLSGEDGPHSRKARGSEHNIIRLEDIEDEENNEDDAGFSVIDRSKFQEDELFNIRKHCPMCGEEFTLTEDILSKRPLKLTCQNCEHGYMLR